ncbi:isopenicillin N synthase family oxygenase [Nakamurella sp. YIM 132087]|uniref:Isopenicillin N synthase family oxygenase n=1 Tax=Nakamurella alba TaxID=2665158 RepID=A0A7K1FNU6_9ACTN|nr:2-oxoglutarate and iron-dependent oxygenase domain-containing protein [Nakamurella alba]MTD15808.1 isopenicillin N synthase family oxygenase [Nakamurella alba]
MTTSPFTVPVVDITPWVEPDGDPADRAAAARALDSACRGVGFVQIIGHGVPDEAIAGLTAAMDAFFGQDLEVKKSFTTPPEINRGYSAPKSESLSLSLGVESASRMNDFFEAFNVGAGVADYPHVSGLPEQAYAENVWPTDAPGFDATAFRAGVSGWFLQAGRVARVLTRMLADALGVDPELFAGATDHSLDVLRMNNYALPPGTVDLDGDLIGMGEHTDYGIVTVLWADQVAGLQVLDTGGTWHDVSPADGALLVNLGDITARWTNENYLSTLHRVKPPIVDGTIRRRRSAAFFHDGNIDAVISTLPGCIGEEGEFYPPITVGEHIEAKLSGSRSGRRNTLAERESARVLSARTP